jgi:hypothetical protein
VAPLRLLALRVALRVVLRVALSAEEGTEKPLGVAEDTLGAGEGAAEELRVRLCEPIDPPIQLARCLLGDEAAGDGDRRHSPAKR